MNESIDMLALASYSFLDLVHNRSQRWILAKISLAYLHLCFLPEPASKMQCLPNFLKHKKIKKIS